MKKVSQITYLASSFLFCAMVGFALEYFYGQIEFYKEWLLGGEPVPGGTEFLANNLSVISYILYIVWALFIAAPLVLRFEKDVQRYCFLTFGFLFLFFTVTMTYLLVMPFIPHANMMQESNETMSETILKSIFWLICVVLSFISVRKYWSDLKKNKDG